MGKSSHFSGQPIYGQLIKSLDREKIVGISRKYGGEKYVTRFDGFTHLLTMLYAVIQRFDSLREIETSITAEVRKLYYVGIVFRSTFEFIYTICGEILAYSENSDEICYEVAA